MHKFFNRRDAIEGARLLAMVCSMLGVVFISLDSVEGDAVGSVSAVLIVMAAAMSALAWFLSRSVRSSLLPLAAGSLVGLIFLCTLWLLVP
ncbi:hypothetical protein [Pseudoxanthomonas sp. GM95]|uniref:hypothetical protein n=1 Tax=Pseudoxanthomonas sp. GM95 TaxID=1881043 RepID=UPI000B88D45F|nr:hypothetical protein [Pseudoxanthomonas sp. GM95]